MKVFTLSVGDYHSKKYSKFNKEIDLTVCTNSNEYWNHYNTISYNEDVFSYYDKLIYSLKFCIEHKEPILYVDVDSLGVMDYDYFINTSESDLLYYRKWVDEPYTIIDDIFDEGIKKKWKNESKHITKIPNIQEVYLYIPYTSKIIGLYEDLVSFKHQWETRKHNLIGYGNRYAKRGIGYGEGTPLGYYLLKHNIKNKELGFIKPTRTLI